MEKNKGLIVQVQGHTDNTGSDKFNDKLSEQRAKSVVEYLTGKGISGNRLKYKGYGRHKPVASNDNEEGRQLNRRTTIKIAGE